MNMHHNPEPQHDDLDVARGIAKGFVLGALIWAVLIGGLTLWLHS